MERELIREGDEYAVSTSDRRPTPTTPGVRAKVLDLKYPTGEGRWVNGTQRPEMGIRVELLGSGGRQMVLRNAGFVLAPWGEYEEEQKRQQYQREAREALVEVERAGLHNFCERLEAVGLNDPEDFTLYSYASFVKITPLGAAKLTKYLATPFD